MAIDYPDPPADYRDRVTIGLFLDVLAVYKRHGLEFVDDEPRRHALALSALGRLADAIAGDVDALAP